MLEDWFERLRQASKDSAVLVEGKRDRQVLERFGVKNVYTLEGKRFTDLPDLLEGFQKVVLLFDLDKKGETIKEKVKNILEKQGYILIEEFREELRRTGILCVEDLYGKIFTTNTATGGRQTHKAKHTDT